MQAIFKMQDGSFIPLNPGLPTGYKGIILKGAETVSFQNASELIVLQNFQRPGFSIKLGIYRFIRVVQSLLEPPAFSTGAMLSLRAEFHGHLEGSGEFRIKAEQFSFIHYAGEELLAEFHEGREYRILDISCSTELLDDTLVYFPKLTKLFQKVMKQDKASIITPPRFAGFQVLELFKRLLHSPYNQSVNEIYFQFKIRESLVLFLVESAKKKVPKIQYTEQEEQLILDLKKRLELDPAGKHPIADLARELGMNSMRLKILFKKIVGSAIFEFHREQRIKEAWQLLKKPELTAKMVASMVGFERVSSFISAFSKRYGVPPSRIQDQK